jgi:hypothetical protein
MKNYEFRSDVGGWLMLVRAAWVRHRSAGLAR